MFISSSPAHVTTVPSSTLRAWWREERRRTGTDWISIGETVTIIMLQLAGASS
jgi:hypothetical protein